MKMRNEEEMMALILGYARNNPHVRAVVMNGSRVNPEAKKDVFQDYDIVYFVPDVAPYWGNREVVDYFGEVMILQTPEDMGDPPADGDGHYTYLIQFMDGNRIDLSFYPLEMAPQVVADSLSLVLLDKDNLIGSIPPPNLSGYLPTKPNNKAFEDCCNEFWWLTPYVAKGLWRNEVTYAHLFLDEYKRSQLMKMLTWYFGVKTGFTRAPGKAGKAMKPVLGDALWQQLEATYASARPDDSWQALLAMDDLFRQVAQAVAEAFGFSYPLEDDQRVSAFARHVKTLPCDAEMIYE